LEPGPDTWLLPRNPTEYTALTVNTEKMTVLKRLIIKGSDTALNRKPISELQTITCRMGSHSVTCHPTQVNVPRLNPSQTGWYSIYLPRRDGRLSWPR